MSRAGTVLLLLGVVLFIALLSWQGFGSVATALAAAGWGLLAVAAFHLLPVVIDALAIETLFLRHERDVSFRDALLARWTGESVNSLMMPAGQIGAPMLMCVTPVTARHAGAGRRGGHHRQARRCNLSHK